MIKATIARIELARGGQGITETDSTEERATPRPELYQRTPAFSGKEQSPLESSISAKIIEISVHREYNGNGNAEPELDYEALEEAYQEHLEQAALLGKTLRERGVELMTDDPAYLAVRVRELEAELERMQARIQDMLAAQYARSEDTTNITEDDSNLKTYETLLMFFNAHIGPPEDVKRALKREFGQDYFTRLRTALGDRRWQDDE